MIADPPAACRLEKLEHYLQQDPGNPLLLAEACDEALAIGALGRAGEHLRTADELGLDALDWALRRGRLCLAQQDWHAAIRVLQEVRGQAGERPGVAHDIAYARFRAGDHVAALGELAPWAEPARQRELDDPARAAFQVLWLRVNHHLRRLPEAAAWAMQLHSARLLAPVAAGVASLVAVDLGDFTLAKLLSQEALRSGALSPEVHVADASVALAEGDTQRAVDSLRLALELNPQDGRSWSALGIASLQARQLVEARSQFARASQLMPDHIGTWHGLGWSCLLLHDRPGALAAFQQALALDRNFAESHGAVGLVLWQWGRDQEAEEHLARAEGLDRHNVTGGYARALQAGRARDAEGLRALAFGLLDRPGVFGGRLSDSLPRRVG